MSIALPKPKIVAASFAIGRMSMVCASAEAESRKYHLHMGKSGRRWLIADQPNAGDNVYIEGERGSEGFGGRTLRFPLVDGSFVDLVGPWHANSDACFADTGIDTRDKHLTFGVVSLGRRYEEHWPDCTYLDLVHQDTCFQVGPFDRITEICKKFVSDYGCRFYYYKQSQGGSSAGSEEPKT